MPRKSRDKRNQLGKIKKETPQLPVMFPTILLNGLSLSALVTVNGFINKPTSKGYNRLLKISYAFFFLVFRFGYF